MNNSKKVLWAALIYVLATSYCASAPVPDPENPHPATRIPGTRWSQSFPDRDFDGGCVTGFLSFDFNQAGYFIYNSHVNGSWQVDEQGNLKLRTKSGRLFTLIVRADALVSGNDYPDLKLKRFNTFRKCSNALGSR